MEVDYDTKSIREIIEVQPVKSHQYDDCILTWNGQNGDR